jgi:carbamoyltransferase
MRILGISTLHDSSVAIINNGKIEFFCKEERLSRKKRDKYPILALEQAFKKAKGKIDIVVISSPTHEAEDNKYIEITILKKINVPIIRLCNEHHLCHAALAFYNSGFKESLSCIIDRNGSLRNGLRESETIFTSKYPCVFKPIYKTYWTLNNGVNNDVQNQKNLTELMKPYPDCEAHADSSMNITKVYETATTLIGQDALENGKTMGLSAYGKDKKYVSLFTDNRPNSNIYHHEEDYNQQTILKEHLHKKINNLTEKQYEFYADHAFQVQKQTQEQVLKLIKRYVKKTGIKNVCLSGGYALNVVTNEYLVKNLPNVNFYFEPLADDSGNSIGAALLIYYNETRNTYKNKKNPLINTFFNNTKHKINVDGQNISSKQIASHLSNGKIVAVYNGVAEAGPRALGNRSILFDPRNKDAKKIINKVKKREWYRPFAVSILESFFTSYFVTHKLKKSPFMTLSFQVKNNKIPGVVHVDNSCRVQTVSKDDGYFFDLLKEFNLVTKVPALLNTSFNLAGEPLIETPKQAIDCFYKSEIDILWFPEIKKGLIK